MRPTGWLVFFGMMLALSLLMGCSREVVKEVLVTPVPGPTATLQPEATESAAETATVTSESETENEGASRNDGRFLWSRDGWSRDRECLPDRHRGGPDHHQSLGLPGA